MMYQDNVTLLQLNISICQEHWTLANFLVHMTNVNLQDKREYKINY